jgi:urease subunit gamma/beta
MHLSPKDLDKLILHNAGFLAQKRYSRGIRLNYPETVALIATQLLEFIRDGESVATLMDKGKKILGFQDVMDGVAEMIHDVQVEGTFPDGTKLVTVHNPICLEEGNPELALYSSGLSRKKVVSSPDNITSTEPGEYLLKNDEITLNKEREVILLEVNNTGDRPVQVGSHYPFFEVNSELQFNREQAYGYRLNIPAGTAVRFEPGEKKKVNLVALAGEKRVYGGNNLIDGNLERNRSEAKKRRKENNFLSTDDDGN